MRLHENEDLFRQAIQFTAQKMGREQMTDVYTSQFREMIFGDEFSSADQILQTLQRIKKRLSDVEWAVKLPEA